MDHQRLIAQWSGALPPGFVRPAILTEGADRCAQPRCTRKVAIKKNGEPAKSCSRCLERRARSCKRRRAALVAEGGCRRCAYRRRLRATSSASVAARTGTSSARRSARMPSRPRLSTSSPPSRSASTRRATSTAGSRLGTQGRSRKLLPRTGRRCRIRNRAKSGSGPGRSATLDGGTGVTDPARAVQTRRLRSSRLTRPRRSQTPLTARRGLSRATGTVGAADPLQGRDTPPTLPVGMATASFGSTVSTADHGSTQRTTTRSPTLPRGERLVRRLRPKWIRPVYNSWSCLNIT